MSFIHTRGFKYFKNLLIGVGASVVMIGALMKITSHPLGNLFITVGLITEAILFLILGILPPEKDYYWEKLYPGLDMKGANLLPLSGGVIEGDVARPLNADQVEGQLGGMLDELQSMSKSLGSLKALQEIDFSETSQQLETASTFYSRLNEAMSLLHDTVEDTKMYKDQMATLNKNLSSLNSVYGNVLGAFNVKA